MSRFNPETPCALCQRPVGEEGATLANNNAICHSCFEICGFSSTTPTNCLSIADIQSLVKIKNLSDEDFLRRSDAETSEAAVSPGEESSSLTELQEINGTGTLTDILNIPGVSAAAMEMPQQVSRTSLPEEHTSSADDPVLLHLASEDMDHVSEDAAVSEVSLQTEKENAVVGDKFDEIPESIGVVSPVREAPISIENKAAGVSKTEVTMAEVSKTEIPSTQDDRNAVPLEAVVSPSVDPSKAMPHKKNIAIKIGIIVFVSVVTVVVIGCFLPKGILFGQNDVMTESYQKDFLIAAGEANPYSSEPIPQKDGYIYSVPPGDYEITMLSTGNATEGSINVETNRVILGEDGTSDYELIRTVSLLSGQKSGISVGENQHIYLSSGTEVKLERLEDTAI